MASFWDRTRATFADIMQDVLSAAVQSIEDTKDFGIGAIGWAGSIFDNSAKGWAARQINKQSPLDELVYTINGGNKVEDFLGFKPRTPVSGIIDDEGSYINDMGEVGQRLVHGTGQGVGQMLPMFLTGGIGSAVGASTKATSILTMTELFMSAGGGSMKQATEEGANYDQAMLYGIASGAVEMATEKITSLAPGLNKTFGKGALDDLISRVATKPVFKAALAVAGEGFEEALSEAVSPYLQKIYKEDTNEWTKEHFEAIAESAIIGGLVSIAYGGGSSFTMQSDLESYQSLINKETRQYSRGADVTETEQTITKLETKISKKLQKMSAEERTAVIDQYQLKNFDKDGNVLETNKGAVNAQAKRGTLPDVKISENVTEDQQKALQIASRLGKRAVVADVESSRYDPESDTIVIDSKSTNPYSKLSHETTHQVEQLGESAYKKYVDAMLNALDQGTLDQVIKDHGFKSTDDLLVAIGRAYSGQAKTPTGQAWVNITETVASLSEFVFDSEESLNKIANNIQDKSTLQKIYDWVKKVVKAFGKDKKMTDQERSYFELYQKAEKLFGQAIKEANSGVKVSDIDNAFSKENEEDEKTDDNRHSLIGIKGLDQAAQGQLDMFNMKYQEILEQLNIAKELQSSNIPNEEIKKQTGWFLSKDENWKFEIDDTNFEIDNEVFNKLMSEFESSNQYFKQSSTIKLGDIIKKDIKLFDLYPNIKDMKFRFADLGESTGRYNIVANLIEFNPSKVNDIKTIQDKIDNLEMRKRDIAAIDAILSKYDDLSNITNEDLQTIENVGLRNVVYVLSFSEYKMNDHSVENHNYEIVFPVKLDSLSEFNKMLRYEADVLTENYEKELEAAKNATKESDPLAKTLLHEIQHYIQTLEGWTNGSNNTHALLLFLNEALDKYKKKNDYNKLTPEQKNDFIDTVFRNKVPSVMRKINYLKNLGEVEARRASERKNMTAEEIKKDNDLSYENDAKTVPMTDSELQYILGYLMSDDSILSPFMSFGSSYSDTSITVASPSLMDKLSKLMFDDVLSMISSPSNSNIPQSVTKSNTRYSMELDGETFPITEEANNLVALHNVYDYKLKRILELGGLPAPSIAVTKPEHSFEEFGDITVVFDKSVVDPNVEGNSTHTRDIYSRTIPKEVQELTDKAQAKMDKIRDYAKDLEDSYRDYTFDNTTKNSAVHDLRYKTYMKYAYVRENNIPFEKSYPRTKYSEIGVDAVKKFVEKHPEIDYNMTADEVMSYKDEVVQMKVDTISKDMPAKYRTSLENLYKDMGWSKMDSIIRSFAVARKQGFPETQYDFYETREALDALVDHKDSKYLKWLSDYVDDMFDPNINYMNDDGDIIPGNLESLTEYMTDGEVVGNQRTLVYSLNNAIAQNAFELDSMEEVKEYADKLVDTATQRELKEALDEFDEKIREVITRDNIDSQSYNLFAVYEDYYMALADVLSGKLDAESALEFHDFDGSHASLLQSLADQIELFPSDYFEAKPQRAVGLNEIKNVILPEDTNQELIDLLEKNNVPYTKYSKEESRTDIIKNMKNIRFSKSLDSDGNKLSVEQEAYFKDSKARDENGNLVPVYHGTNDEFTEFKGSIFYFTDNETVATTYQDDDMDYGDFEQAKPGTNMKGYLNIKNPYILEVNEYWDTIKNPFIDELQDYESNEEFITTEDLAIMVFHRGYDGAILKNVVDVGFNTHSDFREEIPSTVYITFESNQFKNGNNLKPTDHSDIRLSKKLTKDQRSNLNRLAEVQFSSKDGENFYIYAIDTNGNLDTTGTFTNDQLAEKFGNDFYNLLLVQAKPYINRIYRSNIVSILGNNDFEYDQVTEEAKKIFGTTKKIADAAWINTDGSMLDFSDEYNDGRSYDHRDISVVMPHLTREDAMNKYLELGNIRMMPESGYFEFKNKPTDAQMEIIKKGIDYFLDLQQSTNRKPYIGIDMSYKGGFIYTAYEGENAKKSRIINDIIKYYETGEKPKTSGVNHFRYSKELKAKEKAKYTKRKVYNKTEAEKVINSILDEFMIFENYDGKLSGKSKRSAIRALWNMMNTTSEGYRGKALENLVDYIINQAMAEEAVQSNLEDYYFLDAVKSFLRKVDLSTIKADVQHKFGNPAPFAVFGARKNTKSVYTVEDFISDLQEQGIQVEGNNAADQFIYIYERYAKAKDNIKKSIKSLRSVLTRDEMSTLRNDITRRILEGFTEEGKLTPYHAQLEKIRGLKQQLKEANSYAVVLSKFLSSVDRVAALQKYESAEAIPLSADIIGMVKLLKKIKTWRGNLRTATQVREIMKLYSENIDTTINGKATTVPMHDYLYRQNNPDDINGNPFADVVRDIANGKGNLTTTELAELDMILTNFIHNVKEFDKVFIFGQDSKLTEVAQELEKELGEVRPRSDKKLGKWVNSYIETTQAPAWVFENWSGHKADGFFTKFWSELQTRMSEQAQFEREYNDMMDDFFRKNRKELAKWREQTVEINGHKLSMTQMISLYFLSTRPTIQAHLYNQTDRTGIVRIADLSQILPGDAIRTGKDMQITKEFMDSLETKLPKLALEYIGLARKAFRLAQSKGVELDMQLHGVTDKTEKSYFPAQVSKDILYSEMDGQAYGYSNMRIRSLSFNHSLKPNANNKLIIEDVFDVVDRHMKQMQNYILAPSIKAFTKVYNKDLTFRENAKIKTLFGEVFPTGDQYIRKYFDDLQGIRTPAEMKALNSALVKVRGAFARGALGLNVNVLATQFAALIAAKGIGVDNRNLLKGLSMAVIGKTDYEQLYKHSPLMWQRSHDGYDVDLAMKNESKDLFGRFGRWFDWTTKGIEMMDSFNVGAIWNAALEQTKKQYTPYSNEHYEAAARITEEAVIKTQANWVAGLRPALLRTKNEVVKTFTMFISEPLAMFGRLAASVQRIMDVRYAAKQGGMTSELRAEIKAANKSARQHAVSIINSAIFLATLARLMHWIKFGDDDEPFTTTALKEIGGFFTGMFPLVRDVYSYFEGYEISNMYETGLMNVADGFKSLAGIITGTLGNDPYDTQDFLKDGRRMINGFSQLFGIPIRNLETYTTGILEKIDESIVYRYDSTFYKNSYSSDLTKALDKGDEKLADTIVDLMLRDKDVNITDTRTKDEITRLYQSGYNVMPKASLKSITVDDEIIELNKRQYNSFQNTYAKSQDVVAKTISLNAYRELNDATKSKAIKLIYDFYYNLAKENITGEDADSDLTMLTQRISLERLALIIAYYKTATGRTKKQDVISYMRRQRLTSNERNDVLEYLGYAVE